MDTVGEVVKGLLPTVGVTLLFAAAIWAIVRADAAERASRARIEADEDAAGGAGATGARGVSGAVPDDAGPPVARRDEDPGQPIS